VDDYLWLMGRACYKPVIEYCGGTEIGGGFVTGSLLQPQALSAFSTPAMGCNMFILDSNGNPLVSFSMELTTILLMQLCSMGYGMITFSLPIHITL
jgi:acyl-coenzyme A synthetase/AMP-(fatty) acid ligase